MFSFVNISQVFSTTASVKRLAVKIVIKMCLVGR